MPIYEYSCTVCGHELEAIQRISDEPRRDCPKCGKMTLEKLISAAGFRLKGSGWYETDFKNKEKVNSTSAPDTDNSAEKKEKVEEGKRKDSAAEGASSVSGAVQDKTPASTQSQQTSKTESTGNQSSS